MKYTTSKLTLYVTRVITGLVLLLLPLLPFLLNWYRKFRTLSEAEYWAIMIAFYCCAVVIFVALGNLRRILKNILNQQVFTPDNVRCIRAVQRCCGLVSLICIPAAVCYLPLIFMVLIMAFLSLVVGVVAQVTDAAVSLREENDLTI